MNIERRLSKLEAGEPPKDGETYCFIVEEHETEEEVIRRHFGEAGPPENAFIILSIIVSPNSPRAANIQHGLYERFPGHEH